MSSEESKVAILKAAVEGFSTKGFSGVSIRDVANEAGVNHAIIRYHYGSKEDLWMAVFQHLLQQTVHLRNTATFNKDAKDLETEFRNLVRSRVEHVAYHPQLLKLILLELIEGGSRFTQIDSMMRIFYQVSLITIQLLQDVGVMRNLNKKDFLFLLPTLFGSRFLYPNADTDFDGNPIDIEDAIDAHTELVMKMVYKD